MMSYCREITQIREITIDGITRTEQVTVFHDNINNVFYNSFVECFTNSFYICPFSNTVIRLGAVEMTFLWGLAGVLIGFTLINSIIGAMR